MKKYVFISGVSTGIGLNAAEYLLEQGYAVWGSVRKEADAKALEARLGPHFKAFIFDVCDEQAIEAARKEIATLLKDQGLHALVNNAGISVSGPLMYVPVEDIKYQLDVNVLGVIRLCQAFLPLLGASDPSPYSPGKIINISSISGRIASPFIGPYAASKHALEALSDSLRRELAVFDINVVSIQPGPIKTPIWDKAKADMAKRSYPNTPYAAIMEKSKELIAESEREAIEPIAVSRCIHQILRSKNPKARYIIAKKRLMYWIVSYVLPDRWLDAMIKKRLLGVGKG
ncbi:MAG: SDR family oxidoreductase [Bacteroidota bacterium]